MILDLRFDLNTPFTIVLIKKSKPKILVSHKFRKATASMLLKEFYKSLSYIKEDAT